MYKISTVEDQQKFAVPLNEITETLFYNKRMIIDSVLYNSDSENRAWLISKIKRFSPNGICVVTLAQDIYDQHRDYIEKDEDGNIIGMWANYYDSSIEPVLIDNSESTIFSSIVSEITASGNSNQIRIGGSKTFTISFYEGDELIEHDFGSWSFNIDGEDATDILSISFPAENKVRIKFKGDDSYIGKILSITNTSEEIVSTKDVEIIAL